jgi:transcriptional regulator with XRE-family HTH domain
MRQTLAIHAALKRLIRLKGKTYADAATVLDLSKARVKRLFAGAELSVDRVERLCDWLGVDIAHVVELSEGAQPLVTELDEKQEQELLADPALLLVTFLTLNCWSEEDILTTFRFEKVDLTGKLLRLQRLGLIEVFPFGRIKVRAARNFTWRKDGPIQHFFAERVLPEFLATRFDGAGEHMRFVGGMLARASVLKLHEMMDTLARQFDELVRKDLDLPVEERYGVSLLLGFRPWEFSEFTKLRTRPREPFGASS